MGRKKINDKNHTTRIGEKFMKEISEIQKKRIDLGKDKKKRSVRDLSNLIIRHDFWEEIKEDMIELDFKREEILKHEG